MRRFYASNQRQKQEQGLSSWDSMGTEGLSQYFEHYQKLVDRLAVHENGSLPTPTAIQEALNCFVSHKTSLYASKNKTPEIPARCIQKLVHFLHNQYQNNPNARGEWIQQCMSGHDGPYKSMVLAMEFFLRPFMGTAYSLRMARLAGSKSNRMHTRNNKTLQEQEALEALQNATLVYSLLHQVMQNQPWMDVNVATALLRLWKSRCWYLGNSHFGHIQPSPHLIQMVFDGARTTDDCILAMEIIIDKVEANHNLNASQREQAYVALVTAMASTGTLAGALRARELVTQFERHHHNVPCRSLYGATIQVYANVATLKPQEAVQGATELWNHICRQKHHLQSHVFNSLLLTYSNANKPVECEELLRLQEVQQAGGYLPTNIDYNVVVNSWAKSSKPQATQRALALYQYMVQLAETQQRPNVAPDAITYTILIDAVVRNHATGKEGLDLAENLLHHCESEDNPNVKADPTLYHRYMKALSIRLSRQPRSSAKFEIAEQIENILLRMKEKSVRVPPSQASDWHNASLYGLAIEAWTKVESPSPMAKRALDLYGMLKRESQKANGIESLKPDVKIFHDVLICMGNNRPNLKKGPPNHVHAQHVVRMAHSLLDDMKFLGYPLTSTTLNLFLRVLCSRGIRGALEEAENTLVRLEDAYATGHPGVVPDCYSYQVIMEGYARLPGGADPDRAEHLLQQLNALASAYKERKASISPAAAHFTVAMDAWVKSGREDVAENVERLFKDAQGRGIHPTDHMYTTLINSQIEPEKAEALLAQMKADYESGKYPQCKPSAFTFGAYLNCWGRSGREEAAERMEEILMHMHELKDHEGYREMAPTYAAFKNTLFALQECATRRRDAADRAINLIQLVDQYHKDGKLEAGRVFHCYNIALYTIAWSLDRQKAAKAYSLVKSLKEQRHIRRGQDYHAVLTACKETGTLEGATDVEKQEAFGIANKTFLEYTTIGMHPHETVYKEMIDLHGVLLDHDEESSAAVRDELVGLIFTNAPVLIQQSQEVRASLRKVVSSSYYDQLMEKLEKTPC